MHAFDRQTDRQTDELTDGRPTDSFLIARRRLHSMQRSKKYHLPTVWVKKYPPPWNFLQYFYSDQVYFHIMLPFCSQFICTHTYQFWSIYV